MSQSYEIPANPIVTDKAFAQLLIKLLIVWNLIEHIFNYYNGRISGDIYH